METVNTTDRRNRLTVDDLQWVAMILAHLGPRRLVLLF
jgi:hypothetical protein